MMFWLWGLWGLFGGRGVFGVTGMGAVRCAVLWGEDGRGRPSYGVVVGTL